MTTVAERPAPTPADDPPPPAASGPSSRRLHLALAAVAYLPLLCTRPGWISADTKTYLYLDPSRLLGRSWSMWDPTVGLGTVTHQNIGYLWPMGPFYWLGEFLGLPDWATQRLWWGTLLFAAGSGVAYLLRTLGWRGPGVAAAVFAYAFTPYVLTLVARLSGILMPFSGLPWLVALAVLTVRHRGWRHPALFALVVVTVGSMNATALLLVGLAPFLWLLWSVVSGEATVRRALGAAGRLAATTVPVSLWWIAGLTVQRSNGIEILRYTETSSVVAGTSASQEVLRSLGYWFFYGGDRLGAWIEPSVSYTQWPWLLVVSFALPLASLVGSAVARWRHRGYFVGLVLVGTALAVGAFPWGASSPFGRLVRLFQTSEAGLAMRSLPRAVPLVALGMAVGLGGGVTAVARRWPVRGRRLALAAACAAVLALPPLWLGQFVPDNLRRREEIPGYWREAATYLERADHDTRVLVVPGSDFASYRWGNTVDPLLPGLTDRPSVQRELAPYGSPASANLLDAFDLAMQERTIEPQAIAPVARLLRAGDVLAVNDLQYERYNTPRPRNLWDLLGRAPGLGEATGFGPGEPNVTSPSVQLEDELLLLTDPAVPDPPELAVLPVSDPRPVVDARAVTAPLVVAGDGAGLVEAAAAGLVDGHELIRYSASLDGDAMDEALADGAALLVTDSNRLRGERWTTLRHNRGMTEPASGGVLDDDLNDNRLPVFPGAGTSAMTVAAPRPGAIEATATSYGNPITFAPEERPALAVDGDLRTSWRAGALVDARGQRLELALPETVTTDRVRLTQPVESPGTRYVTRVRLRFDGGGPVDVDLGVASRAATGEAVTFPSRTFSSLSIEVLADTAGSLPGYGAHSGVGFAEVEVGGRPNPTDPSVDAVRVPTDLLATAGARSLDHPLALSFTRQRQDPTDVTRQDGERLIARVFTLPTDRSFSLTGSARLSARADADVVDALLGRPHDDDSAWVRASADLNGSVGTPSAAFDGDDTTAWTTVRAGPAFDWVEVVLPDPVTVDELPLTLLADGLHSLPTEIDLAVDGESVGRYDVPEVEPGDRQGHTAETVVDIPRVTGSRFLLRITGLDETSTNDWVGDRPVAQPVGIAEVGLPGPRVADLDTTFDSGCRDDLVRVDGRPLPVRVTGPTADALAGRPLAVEECDGGDVDLAAGDRLLQTSAGVDGGIDVDRLVLRSAAGGAASPATSTLVDEADPGGERRAGTPRVEVLSERSDQVRLRITGATAGEPFWLVLGQSYNSGWQASYDAGSMGPELVDGFANGWRITPTDGEMVVELRFTPQWRVDAGLWVSGVAALACLALTFRRPRPVGAWAVTVPDPLSGPALRRYMGAMPPIRTAVVLAAGLAVGAWLLAGPLVGAVVGAAALAAGRRDGARAWLVAGSAAALAAAVGYVLYVQLWHAPEASFHWPFQMRRAHPLGWLALLLLVTDTVVGTAWRHAGRRTGRSP